MANEDTPPCPFLPLKVHLYGFQILFTCLDHVSPLSAVKKSVMSLKSRIIFIAPEFLKVCTAKQTA